MVNYALHLQADGLDVPLLTDDTICSATASEFGLPAKPLPEHWLRDAEADERAKEIARLSDENKRLRAAEPCIELMFFSDDETALSKLEADVPLWPPLSEEDVFATTGGRARKRDAARSTRPCRSGYARGSEEVGRGARQRRSNAQAPVAAGARPHLLVSTE